MPPGIDLLPSDSFSLLFSALTRDWSVVNYGEAPAVPFSFLRALKRS
jgi:hypothetical protein